MRIQFVSNRKPGSGVDPFKANLLFFIHWGCRVAPPFLPFYLVAFFVVVAVAGFGFIAL